MMKSRSQTLGEAVRLIEQALMLLDQIDCSAVQAAHLDHVLNSLRTEAVDREDKLSS